MKNLFKISFVLLSFLMILSFSNDTKPNDFVSKETSNQSILLKNGDISKINHPVEFTGEFQIWKSKSGETVFYTESEKSIHVFTCLDCENTGDLNFDSNGTLTFLEHSFVFKNRNESSYFAVEKPEEKEIKITFNLEFNSKNEFYGSGIVYNWFDKNIKDTNPNLSYDIKNANNIIDFIFKLNRKNAELNGCDSGGSGSTSCSAGGGGCSVSCGAGYACCNGSGATSSCTCKSTVVPIG